MIQSILHRELLEDRSGVVQSEEDFEPVTEVNPLSDFDWSETSGDEVESGESESEQVAEVFEPVSDASDESGFESGFESGWESESGFDQGFESEEVAEGSTDYAPEFAPETTPEVPAESLTYREITGEDVSWDGFESGSETGSEAVSESGSGSEFVSESQEVAEFTAPETAEFDTNSFDPADFIEEVAGVEKVLPADFDESQWSEYGFEEVAPGIAIEQDFSSICGQLIISLPGGGALQLDWPLSASDWTNASTVDFSEENESAFTEVDSSDFE